LEKVFSQFNGFHEVRLAKDKNRQRIAFVDYDSPQAAEYAMSSTVGYRLSNANKGISKDRFPSSYFLCLYQPSAFLRIQKTTNLSLTMACPLSDVKIVQIVLVDISLIRNQWQVLKVPPAA